MAVTKINNFKELKKTATYAEVKNDRTVVKSVSRVKKDLFTKRYVVTGRRKTSVVTIWVEPSKGSGLITVNGKSLQEYFERADLVMIVNQPLEVTNSMRNFDITAKAVGGGKSGQAQALRLAISWFLAEKLDASEGGSAHPKTARKVLKVNKLLTRDSREVQPKHYGRRKARKTQQWSKR